jgi:hypothetical protein
LAKIHLRNSFSESIEKVLECEPFRESLGRPSKVDKECCSEINSKSQLRKQANYIFQEVVEIAKRRGDMSVRTDNRPCSPGRMKTAEEATEAIVQG